MYAATRFFWYFSPERVPGGYGSNACKPQNNNSFINNDADIRIYEEYNVNVIYCIINNDAQLFDGIQLAHGWPMGIQGESEVCR
jgi:hypothetical protein